MHNVNWLLVNDYDSEYLRDAYDTLVNLCYLLDNKDYCSLYITPKYIAESFWFFLELLIIPKNIYHIYSTYYNRENPIILSVEMMCNIYMQKHKLENSIKNVIPDNIDIVFFDNYISTKNVKLCQNNIPNIDNWKDSYKPLIKKYKLKIQY